ncbi:MAG: hypothetical protein ABI835_17730 [Chloroflexota bacterium]
MKTQPGASLQTSTLLADFRLLLILFLFFRLMLLMIYQPLFAQGGERGMTAGGDFFYYFQLGSLSGQGFLPFRDWWSEFPPIPAFFETVLFQLFGRSGYPAFAMIYSVIMLMFDVGNLVLMRRIGTQLYGAGTGMALAWIYALTLAPLVMIWWNFEPAVAFFLLWALALLVERRDVKSAVIAAVGGLVKFTPLLILGALWRFRSPRIAFRYSLIALGIFAAVYVALFAQNSAMTLPSLTAQFNKASYQTVWALIDGNFKTGNFGSPIERLDPANAYRLVGHPSVIPGFVRLGAAALIGIFVYWRTRRFDDRGLVAFVTITLLIFFLQAQGWSPQWLSQIVPLILLCFPTRDGVTAVVLLSLVTFAEYPFLFIRTGDTGGEITGRLMTPFVALVLARTAILVGMCVALYKRLRQEAVVPA